MKKNKFRFLFGFIFLTLLFFIIFHYWNDNPPLPKKSNPPIIKLKNINSIINNTTYLKIASYNIHFGIGFDVKTKKIEKTNYLHRLNKIADILKEINADIVLLQEVDFDSKRSSNIDESIYIAKKAGYTFIAKSPTLRKKIHLSFHNIIGNICHGLCILSKYPIEDNENIIFEHSKEIPIIAKWLFDPHGTQKCVINFDGTKINIINLHLDPWSQSNREAQIEFIKQTWLTKSNMPTIIGGDFNSLSPNSKKEGYYMQDAPWFIDKSKWNIKNELTIPTLIHAGFKEADPTILSLKGIRNYTYPSDNPKEKIDFIFSKNKTKIIKGYVYKEAKDASDHLPIFAEIKINNN